MSGGACKEESYDWQGRALWRLYCASLVALHSNGTNLVLVEKLDCLARDTLMIQESITACAHTQDHSRIIPTSHWFVPQR